MTWPFECSIIITNGAHTNTLVYFYHFVFSIQFYTLVFVSFSWLWSMLSSFCQISKMFFHCWWSSILKSTSGPVMYLWHILLSAVRTFKLQVKLFLNFFSWVLVYIYLALDNLYMPSINVCFSPVNFVSVLPLSSVLWQNSHF